jgi:hypothetical protein
VHPLHVESVAWVAERKDVLSTLFWFLTVGAYVRWIAARPRPVRRDARRVRARPHGEADARHAAADAPSARRLAARAWSRAAAARLVVEKLPLFALAAASAL